jgi:hypothetical protein
MFEQLVDFEAGNIKAKAKEVQTATKQMTVFAEEAARQTQRAFAEFLFDPFSDGLNGMLDGFLNTIRRMVAEIAASQILSGIFGGLAGSSNIALAAFGGSFGGARARGGPVSTGSTYLVGEKGPELFTPSASGQIIPGGGGGANVQIVDQRGAGAPPVDVQQQMVAGRQMIKVMIRDEIGGVFGDGTIERMFSASSMPVRRTGRRYWQTGPRRFRSRFRLMDTRQGSRTAPSEHQWTPARRLFGAGFRLLRRWHRVIKCYPLPNT